MFKSLALAESYRNRCVKLMLIVMDESGKFSVVVPRQAEEMVAAGTHQYV